MKRIFKQTIGYFIIPWATLFAHAEHSTKFIHPYTIVIVSSLAIHIQPLSLSLFDYFISGKNWVSGRSITDVYKMVCICIRQTPTNESMIQVTSTGYSTIQTNTHTAIVRPKPKDCSFFKPLDQ